MITAASCFIPSGHGDECGGQSTADLATFLEEARQLSGCGE